MRKEIHVKGTEVHRNGKNMIKTYYRAGQKHVNSRGKLVPEKFIKTANDCLVNCRFKCCTNFEYTVRQKCKHSFYSLQQNEKSSFLLNHAKRVAIKRKRCADSNKRCFAFEYFLTKNSEKVRVCIPFFLNTFSIGQKSVQCALKEDRG